MKTEHTATAHPSLDRREMKIRIKSVGRESDAHAKAFRVAADVIEAMESAECGGAMPEVKHADTRRLGGARGTWHEIITYVVVEIHNPDVEERIERVMRRIAERVR